MNAPMTGPQNRIDPLLHQGFVWDFGLFFDVRGGWDFPVRYVSPFTRGYPIPNIVIYTLVN